MRACATQRWSKTCSNSWLKRLSLSASRSKDSASQRSISGKLISCLSIIEGKTPKGEFPEIPSPRTALSDYLCVNRSALQREIAKLKQSGTLTISKRKFRLDLSKYTDVSAKNVAMVDFSAAV